MEINEEDEDDLQKACMKFVNQNEKFLNNMRNGLIKTIQDDDDDEMEDEDEESI